jgi:hypothetical protein
MLKADQVDQVNALVRDALSKAAEIVAKVELVLPRHFLLFLF